MDAEKKRKTRRPVAIKITTKNKRIPIELIPIVDDLVEKHKQNIRQQRKLLSPKYKNRQELLQELELLKSQLNLPCEKEKGGL